MRNDRKLIPKRRFKEFINDGAWEQRELGDIVDRISVSSINSSLPLIEYEDVVSDQGTLAKDFRFNKSNKKGIEFKRDDILFGYLRPYLNNRLLAHFSGLAVGDWWVLRSRKVNSNFIYNLIQTQKFQSVANLSTGTKMPRADWSTMESSGYFIPLALEEQQEIGNFFSKLDQLITLHQRKLEKLKNIKSAYLSKMFPKDGEKSPELRFAGFTDAWEQRELGEVVNVCSGRDYKHLSEGDIPVYGTGGYMLSVNDALSFKDDAIGIGRKGTIDKPYILKSPFWTVDTLFYAIPTEGNDINFIYNIFQIINWKQKDESTGVPSLSKTAINDIDILIAKYTEQEKIGSFFIQLDNLITLHQRKLEKLKNIKKAYLNEMFV